jgi:sigma-B regulation protein RsbU (phosphoserine phosphatase)
MSTPGTTRRCSFDARYQAEPTSLDNAGLPLGMFPKSVYDHQQVPLCEGDVLVLYADGVTDARNSAGDEFGEDRLSETISGALTLPAAQIGDRIRKHLEDFVGPTPAFDDITLVVVVVKRRPPAPEHEVSTC